MQAKHHVYALTLAAACVCVSVWLSTGSANHVAPLSPEDEPAVYDTTRLEDLERRIAAIESRLGEVRSDRDSVRETTTPPDEILERLTALERAIAPARETRTPDPFRALVREQERRDRAREQERADRAKEIETAKQVLANAGAPVDDKLVAHRSLRRVADAYTPRMIQDLIRIAQTDPRPEARANVWTFFDGSTTSPQLIEPLLHAMRFDRSDAVRAEAAETLGNYTENAAVMQALERAARQDKSKRVREKAMRSVPRR